MTVDAILIFFVSNVAITSLRLGLLSTVSLILGQCIICFIGLYATGRNWHDILSYFINDFLSLGLALIFSFLGAYAKEQFMRQIFLIRFFQREEALILSSSRLKLDITEQGMKALKVRLRLIYIL
jgi:hypothetical protein